MLSILITDLFCLSFIMVIRINYASILNDQNDKIKEDIELLMVKFICIGLYKNYLKCLEILFYS